MSREETISRVLLDRKLSEGARLLYLLLDDQASEGKGKWSKIIGDKRLSVGARLLYCVIDHLTGETSGPVSNDEIAKSCGIGRREFSRRMADLKSLGYITDRKDGAL